MSINLNVPVQQALNELAPHIRKRRATVYKGNMPSLDLDHKHALDLFKSVFGTILLTDTTFNGCTIKMDAIRDIEAGKWLVSIFSDVNLNKSSPQQLSQLEDSARQVGAEISIKKNLKASVITLVFPYTKISI